VITTFSLFQTSRTFDANGAVQRFANGGSFQMLTLNPYLEYGLTSRYTLVVNTQVPFLDYRDSYGNQRSAGFGDTEVAVRRRLIASDSPWVLSGQLTVMFPMYSARRDPAPGNHQEDVEIRFLAGRGQKLWRRHTFWDGEVAYRSRFGAPADQVRADLTAGIDITPRVMAMGQLFNSISMRNGQPLDTITNPNAQSDFDLHKGQVSLVTAVRRGTRIQVGWNDTLSGRNTGRGQTALIALWKDF
jgi:hypothetical protein